MPDTAQTDDIAEDDSLLDVVEDADDEPDSRTDTPFDPEVEPDNKIKPPPKKKGGQHRPLPVPDGGKFKLSLEEFVRYQQKLKADRKWEHIRIYAYGLWPVR